MLRGVAWCSSRSRRAMARTGSRKISSHWPKLMLEEDDGPLGLTFYRWRKKFGGLGVPELRELRQLREENRRLTGLVANLRLDKKILQYAVRREW